MNEIRLPKGLYIRRFGHLLQLRSDTLKTLYQSHSINDIERFVSSRPVFLTSALGYGKCSATPVQFGRTTKRP